jgi:hypothetical protein
MVAVIPRPSPLPRRNLPPSPHHPSQPHWRLNGFTPVIYAGFSHLQQLTGFPTANPSQLDGNEEIWRN